MLSRRWVLPVALVVAAGCGASGKSASVTAPPTTSAVTTTSLPVEEQVKAAYLHSWDVYADAVRRLDPSHLSEVFAEPHLTDVRGEVADLERRSRAVDTVVRHNIHVRVIDATTALVADDVMNHSVEFDRVTERPTERDPNDLLRDNNTMKLIEGTWKVTVVIRQH